MASSTLFRRPATPPATDYEKVIAKLTVSDTPVTLIKCKEKMTDLLATSPKELIDEAKEKQDLVFTFTPGPFKSTDPLPKDWKATPGASGCTAQLKACAKASGIRTIAVNNHSMEYQDAMLKQRKSEFSGLEMISGEHLFKELGLDTFKLESKTYLHRFSIAIPAHGEAKAFTFPANTADDTKAAKHVEEITEYFKQQRALKQQQSAKQPLAVKVERQPENDMIETPVGTPRLGRRPSH